MGLKTSHIVFATPFSLSASYFVVANDIAADTKAWAKAAQDAGSNVYVCDGVADDVQIQAAIDNLTNGGDIYLSAGNFSITTRINGASNIQLIGSGWGTVLTWAGANYDTTGNIRLLDFNGKSNWGVAYIKLNGGAQTEGNLWGRGGCNNFHAHHIRSLNTNALGGNIWFQGCTEGWVYENYVGDGSEDKGGGFGFTEGCEDIYFFSNYGVDTYDSFVSVGSSGASQTKNILVLNNISTRSVGTGGGYGLDVFGNADNIIAVGNKFHNTVGHCVCIHPNGALTYYPLYVKIHSNIISGVNTATRDGISANGDDTSGLCEIQGNYISMSASGRDGCRVVTGAKTIFAGNIVRGNSATGYGLLVTSGKATDIRQGNDISGFDSGTESWGSLANCTESPTKELFIPATQGTELFHSGNYSGYRINADGEIGSVQFAIPVDFTAIRSSTIVWWALASTTNMAFSVNTSFCSNGEANNTHTDGGTITRTTIDGIIYEDDIAAFLTGVAANDFVGLETSRGVSGNTNAVVLGIRLRYH